MEKLMTKTEILGTFDRMFAEAKTREPQYSEKKVKELRDTLIGILDRTPEAKPMIPTIGLRGMDADKAAKLLVRFAEDPEPRGLLPGLVCED